MAFFSSVIVTGILAIILPWASIFIVLKHGYKRRDVKPLTILVIVLIGLLLQSLLRRYVPIPEAGLVGYAFFIGIAIQRKYGLRAWQAAVCSGIVVLVRLLLPVIFIVSLSTLLTLTS